MQVSVHLPMQKELQPFNGVNPSSYHAQGCYFMLSNTKVSHFIRLIYPTPEDMVENQEREEVRVG